MAERGLHPMLLMLEDGASFGLLQSCMCFFGLCSVICLLNIWGCFSLVAEGKGGTGNSECCFLVFFLPPTQSVLCFVFCSYLPSSLWLCAGQASCSSGCSLAASVFKWLWRDSRM